MNTITLSQSALPSTPQKKAAPGLQRMSHGGGTPVLSHLSPAATVPVAPAPKFGAFFDLSDLFFMLDGKSYTRLLTSQLQGLGQNTKKDPGYASPAEFRKLIFERNDSPKSRSATMFAGEFLSLLSLYSGLDVIGKKPLVPPPADAQPLVFPTHQVLKIAQTLPMSFMPTVMQFIMSGIEKLADDPRAAQQTIVNRINMFHDDVVNQKGKVSIGLQLNLSLIREHMMSRTTQVPSEVTSFLLETVMKQNSLAEASNQAQTILDALIAKPPMASTLVNLMVSAVTPADDRKRVEQTLQELNAAHPTTELSQLTQRALMAVVLQEMHHGEDLERALTVYKKVFNADGELAARDAVEYMAELMKFKSPVTYSKLSANYMPLEPKTLQPDPENYWFALDQVLALPADKREGALNVALTATNFLFTRKGPAIDKMVNRLLEFRESFWTNAKAADKPRDPGFFRRHFPLFLSATDPKALMTTYINTPSLSPLALLQIYGTLAAMEDQPTPNGRYVSDYVPYAAFAPGNGGLEPEYMALARPLMRYMQDPEISPAAPLVSGTALEAIKNVSGVRMNQTTDKTLSNLSRIGTLAMSYRKWKMETMSRQGGAQPSLFEESGLFKKAPKRPEDDAKFHGGYLHVGPDGLFIEMRHAYVVISKPELGTLVVRNSGYDFGRDLLKAPFYYNPYRVVTESDLLSPDKELPHYEDKSEGLKGFYGFSSEDYFVANQLFGRNSTSRMNNMKALLDSYDEVMGRYNQWKYDFESEKPGLLSVLKAARNANQDTNPPEYGKAGAPLNTVLEWMQEGELPQPFYRLDLRNPSLLAEVSQFVRLMSGDVAGGTEGDFETLAPRVYQFLSLAEKLPRAELVLADTKGI